MTQGMLFKPPPKMRGLWYRHLPPAVQIHRRLVNATTSPTIRRFLEMEFEVGERVAARLAAA